MSQHQPSREIPLRDFFRNAERTNYKISPEGGYLSFTQPYERRMNIFVQSGTGTEIAPARITSLTDRDISGYWWKTEDRLVYLRDVGGNENWHIYAVNKDGSEQIDLTPFENVRVELIDDLEDEPSQILVGMNKRDPQVFDVYRLNIQNGELKLVAENPGNIVHWMTDHSGKVRVAIATNGVDNTLLHRKTEEESFLPVLTTSFRESLAPLFFAFDNKQIFAASNVGRDRSAIVRYDLDTASEAEVLYEHPEVDVENLSYSRHRKVLLSYIFTTWKTERKFLDAEYERMFSEFSNAVPNSEITIASHTRDEQHFIIRTYSDRSLGSFYLYDVPSRKITKLADVGPWLKSEELSKMEPIEYKSRDGLKIHGYLTLPNGSDGTNLPIVVNPHGGPWVRDKWTYNPEVQFLANRGYGVLQINYRGSTGYGRKFWESSFKEWGRTMQDDVSDGVRWLIEQGIADKKNIAIYGGSYGGYCTLAGVTFTPDLYACAIDYVGVSNLLTFLETIPPYWKPMLDMMYEMVGNPITEKEMLMAASPVFHVDKIKAPLLVAQGANDPRVNINESNQIVEALRKRNIDVEYIVKDNEGHGFHNEENRFEFYEAMERFLKKHLKNKKAA